MMNNICAFVNFQSVSSKLFDRKRKQTGNKRKKKDERQSRNNKLVLGLPEPTIDCHSSFQHACTQALATHVNFHSSAQHFKITDLRGYSLCICTAFPHHNMHAKFCSLSTQLSSSAQSRRTRPGSADPPTMKRRREKKGVRHYEPTSHELF